MSHEVVAALIVRSGQILLGQRSAGRTFYPNVWDMFGGHIEPGEQLEQTLVRELHEELGITPTEWKYLETVSVSRLYSSDPMIVHLYLVTAWQGTPYNRQPEEHSVIGWFSPGHATQLDLADPIYPALFARYLESH